MRQLYRYSWIYLFLGFVVIYSCSDDSNNEPQIDPSIAYEELDVSYGSDPLQTYDVYLPAARTESNTHVIVLIHGGGWVSGDKEDVDGIVDLLQVFMPDYAVINMNYRLTAEENNPFRDQLDDVNNVLIELDIKSNTYNVSDSYVLVGVSAGGHMAMQHSYTKNAGGKIKAVGNIIGPTYFLDPAYTMATDPFLAILANEITTATGVPFSDVSFYEAISPFNAVTPSSPPTIQFHGSDDPLIPDTQGPLLKAALDDNNVPNELIIYDGEGHGWTNPDNWNDTATRFRDFVELYIED